MTLYAVRCLSPHGGVVSLSVDADSASTAPRHPRVAHRQVLSVRRHWKEWLGLRHADLNEQRLLLTQMSMHLARGGMMPEELAQMIAQLPTLQRNLQSREPASLVGMAPAELLLQLNCHPFAVALCREGERLGTVPDMLLRASDFLQQQQHSRRQLHGPLLRAGLYTLATLAMFVVTPFLFQQLLAHLADHVVIQTTLATDILMTLHTALTTGLPLTLAAAGSLAAAGYHGWNRLRKIPPFKDIDGLVRGRRAAILLDILEPSFRKGVNLADLFRSLHPVIGQRTSRDLYARLRAGHSLSQSLTERRFSHTLTSGLHRFEEAPETQLPRLFSSIRTCLHTEIDWYLERVVRWARWFYSALLLLLMLLLITGFLQPIYSISVQ